MRLPASKAAAQQRSINLAISSRGIAALQAVLGPEATARFLQTVIPMRGRMIHHVNGKLDSQQYDRHGQVRPQFQQSGFLPPDNLIACYRNVLTRPFYTHISVH
jgi:hypothetical protein